MNTLAKRSWDWPGWLVLPVVVGYVTMARSFAHIGISPIFVGEATLGALLLFRPSVILGTWLGAIARRSPYSILAAASALFVGYGLLECVRGVLTSEFPAAAVRNFAFNAYVAFLFAGLWLGERHPKLLPRAIYYIAWANGIYGLLYIGVLSGFDSVNPSQPDTVQIFGQPAGSAIALLGLLAYRRELRWTTLPLLMNATVLLGIQVRAEWVGLAVAMTMLSLLTHNVLRLFQFVALLATLLLLAAVVELQVPAPSSRGGTISTHDIVGRAVAAFDQETAAQFTPDAAMYADTVSWRTKWWENLIELTHADPVSVIFGMGYGYPIWMHNYFDTDFNPTPHNIFIYVLVYTGWLGVLLFYLLQICIGSQLWRAFRLSGQAFGICFWALMLVWAHFDNRMEAPFGAIPYYVLAGMAISSGLAMVNRHDERSETSTGSLAKTG